MTPPNITEAARMCASNWRDLNKHYEPLPEHVQLLAEQIQLAITTATAPLEQRVKELERQAALYSKGTQIFMAQRDALTQKLAMVEKEVQIKNSALCFFQSVIKSGEQWTEHCENTLRLALNPPTQPTKESNDRSGVSDGGSQAEA
jgi:uncharacterized protein YhaN